MDQLEWQRSVIREEMYENMSMLRLGQEARKGDVEAKREWKRRWDEDFPKVRTSLKGEKEHA